MATTLHLRNSRTTMAGTDDRVFGMSTAAQSTLAMMNFVATSGATQVGVAHVQSGNVAYVAPDGLKYEWLSDRLSAPVTVSAQNVTVAHGGRNGATMTSINATYRIELFKITSSGNVETPLGTKDEPAVASGETSSTVYSTTLNVPTAVSLAIGERFGVRISLIPVAGQTMGASGTNALGIEFSSTSGSSQDFTLGFAETMTFTPNVTRLYPRRTTANATLISGSNFMDILTTKVSQTGATGVTTIPAGATEVQATKTAGGAALEFITPRFAGPWTFGQADPTISPVNTNYEASENSVNVNAAMVVKIYRWRVGAETLIFDQSGVIELGTSLVATALGNANVAQATATSFLADDRLIYRYFFRPFAPATTMGAGTVTVRYDAGSAITPAGWFELLDLPQGTIFKAETDPATPPTVPNASMMFGLQN